MFSAGMTDTSSVGQSMQTMGNYYEAQGYGSAAAGTLQAIGAICVAVIQNRMMDDAKDHAVAKYGIQKDIATIQHDSKINALAGEQEKIQVQVEGQKEYLAAVRDRKKAEGELAVVDAHAKEEKLTEKAGETNEGKMNQALDSWFYGNPG